MKQENCQAAPLFEGFIRRESAGGALFCEDVPVAELARRFGTPLYVYSKRMIESRYDAYDQAFGDEAHAVCYAAKANAAQGILELLAQRGAGFDTVSGGEIERVLAAGADPKKIVFSGVGKSRKSIAMAILAGIRAFNIESIEELDRIEAIAAELKKTAPVAVRINPDIDAHVDHHVATGIAESKFGVDLCDALPLYRRAHSLPHIEVVGVSCHIGSQIQSAAPYLEMADMLAKIASGLDAEGIELKHVDIGGGAGIAYRSGEHALRPQELIPAVLERLKASLPKGKAYEYIVEPGRSIVAEAGILLTRVEFIKRIRTGRRFAIVDAAMTDLLRPALYGAWHHVERVAPASEGAEESLFDIAGPVCESTDVLAEGRRLALAQDDLLVFRNAGAYGMSMASNYNSRPLPFEMLVSDNQAIPLQRNRQTPLDLIESERSLLDPVEHERRIQAVHGLEAAALEAVRAI